MQTRTDVATLYPALKQKLKFAYDAQCRRIAKTVKTPHPTTGLWQIIEEVRFVYDGWNLLAELTPIAGTTSYNILRTYTWGLDLSGSPQGAGGVGGLLWANLNGETHIAGYDGNGNVTAWVDMASGYITGQRDYGPFGEPLQVTGAARGIPFAFSTKYTDQETGLLYYGFRYYNPSTGRWLSRDPIEERGGVNLYAFVKNNSVNSTDALGLLVFSPTSSTAWMLAALATTDIQGRQILIRYLSGAGDLTIMNDSSWTSYVQSDASMQSAARASLQAFIDKNKIDTKKVGQEWGYYDLFAARFESGSGYRATGYYLIHGLIRGLRAEGRLRIGSDCKLTGSVRYDFRDRIDPNVDWNRILSPVFYFDAFFSGHAEVATFGVAESYNLTIHTVSDFSMTPTSGGKYSVYGGEGWPVAPLSK